MSDDEDPRPKRWRDADARVTQAIVDGKQPDPSDVAICNEEQETWDRARAANKDAP